MTETKTLKALILLVVVVVGAVVVAGCGGSGSSSSTESATSQEGATGAGGGAAEEEPEEGASEEEPAEGKETGGAEAGEGTEKVPGETNGIEADETEAEAGGGAEAGGAAAGEGKTVFTANCGVCHTLKEAGTSGTVGPNLDELEPSLAAAEKQVENGGGGMPAFKGQLSPEEIKNVATYVSTVAGTE
jgi:mono/diheme cytochrome c family protein